MQLFGGPARVVPGLIFSVRASDESVQLQYALWRLNKASKALSSALDAEAVFGERAFATHGNESAPALARWQACRKEVEHRQEAYYEAVRHFREYVSSLPRHLRSSATKKGLRAMGVGSR